MKVWRRHGSSYSALRVYTYVRTYDGAIWVPARRPRAACAGQPGTWLAKQQLLYTWAQCTYEYVRGGRTEEALQVGIGEVAAGAHLIINSSGHHLVVEAALIGRESAQ